MHISFRLDLVKSVKRTNTNFAQLWKQVGMDLIGPMPVTARGNKYIITLTDYFSKWAEAAPLLDKTAHGIAKFVYTVSFIPNNYTVVIILKEFIAGYV